MRLSFVLLRLVLFVCAFTMTARTVDNVPGIVAVQFSVSPLALTLTPFGFRMRRRMLQLL